MSLGWIDALDIINKAVDIHLRLQPAPVGIDAVKKTQADLLEEAKPKIPYGWIIGGVVGIIAILLIMKYVR